MKGEALLDDSGWHHIVYTSAPPTTSAARVRGRQDPNMKSHLQLSDPAILEEWRSSNGITNMVQTVFPAVTFQQISNCLGVQPPGAARGRSASVLDAAQLPGRPGMADADPRPPGNLIGRRD
jgi:hypothetical protein